MSYSYDGNANNKKAKLNELSSKIKSPIEDIINNPNFKAKNTCLDNSYKLKHKKDYEQIIVLLEEMHISTFAILMYLDMIFFITIKD